MLRSGTAKLTASVCSFEEPHRVACRREKAPARGGQAEYAATSRKDGPGKITVLIRVQSAACVLGCGCTMAQPGQCQLQPGTCVIAFVLEHTGLWDKWIIARQYQCVQSTCHMQNGLCQLASRCLAMMPSGPHISQSAGRTRRRMPRAAGLVLAARWRRRRCREDERRVRKESRRCNYEIRPIQSDSSDSAWRRRGLTTP